MTNISSYNHVERPRKFLHDFAKLEITWKCPTELGSELCKNGRGKIILKLLEAEASLCEIHIIIRYVNVKRMCFPSTSQNRSSLLSVIYSII